MEADRTPCTEQNRNIAMLEDRPPARPRRVFLPTSASGRASSSAKRPAKATTHGWWQYQGNPEQYRFFGGSDSLFHSEFGCDGMASLASLKKGPAAKGAAPGVHAGERRPWRFHGDWWCTYRREQTMFGAWKDTEQYIACSQWMQAEGLRYILEANRRRCFRNSGSIIWQLNEPWPNISCTSLLEYHGAAKMAYFWAKAAFRPVHPAFDYTRLDYAPGGLLSGGLAVLRDAPAAGESTLIAQIFDMAGTCLFEEVRSRTRVREGAEEFGALCWQVPESLRGLFLLRLTAHAAGEAHANTYYFSTEADRPYRPALEAAPVLSGTARLFRPHGRRGSREHRVLGGAACACPMRRTASCSTWRRISSRFCPAETKRLRVGFRRKFRFGFDENTGASAASPVLRAALPERRSD